MTFLSALAGDAQIAALLSDEAQIRAMLRFETALAEASAEVGLISPADAAAIKAVIANFVPDWDDLGAGMVRDGVVVPALVAQLRPMLPEAQRAALHKGATSQDAIDTALMLQLAPVFDVFEARLTNVLRALDDFAASAGDRAFMAHTRMQAALPTTWQAKVLAWREPLQRHLSALVAMRRTLLCVQLGGPVGDRSSFAGHGDAIAAAMARRLDLGVATPWHTQRDPVVALGTLLALICGALGKIGADVVLLAQSEVKSVRLTGGGGSSAMTHKSNPVGAEVLVALARQVAGLAGTLNQALVHEYERSGAAWTLEWLTLPPMLIATGASLRLGRDTIARLQFD